MRVPGLLDVPRDAVDHCAVLEPSVRDRLDDLEHLVVAALGQAGVLREPGVVAGELGCDVLSTQVDRDEAGEVSEWGLSRERR